MMTPQARRKTFRAALALEEMTQADWCEKHDITEGHLSHVLNERRTSKKLAREIEEFVRVTFNKWVRPQR